MLKLKKGILIGLLLITGALIISGCEEEEVREAPLPIEQIGEGGGGGGDSVTYQGVLDMLESCNNYLAQFGETCSDACDDVNKTCILSDVRDQQFHTSIEDCSTTFTNASTAMECICCSP